MKILLLGAAGNLGSQLEKFIAARRENNLLALDREDLDITDLEALEETIGRFQPELIINAAAYNAVDKCAGEEEEYEKALKINARAPEFLAEKCFARKIVLAHYSTDYVFSGRSRAGYKESGHPEPINRYGFSKYLGEKAVAEKMSADVKFFIIRTSRLFGPPGPGEAKPNFFELMLKLSAGKEELTAVADETACFTYTPDLAAVTWALIREEKAGGIFHLINEGPASWYEAAGELFRQTAQHIYLKPVLGEIFSRPAARPHYSVLLNTKRPKLRPYQEALRDYLKLITVG